MDVIPENYQQMRSHSLSLRRHPSHASHTRSENGKENVEYFGNMLVRRQYYGSMEMIPKVEEEPDNPISRKISRFRVEPSDDSTQLIARSPSLAKLENPEFQTRWYFKFFLGIVHNNYAFLDNNKEPHALSICLTDAENHGIPQYRAILWQKSGCRRICLPYFPNKTYGPREVLSYFGMDKMEKNPREIVAPEVQKELLVLEEQEGSVNFKFGVIYAQHGQTTDDEMFGNVSGSREFIQFLNVLGDTIDLKGWTGYRGGLDVKDNMTGINSVYTMFEGHEVMFHVSVMLPYSKDTQQVERKRHIGNDIAVIVFVDGEPDEELAFKPSSVRTKFTHVFAVIRYSKKRKSYWLSVFSEENVPAYGPPIPVPACFTNPQEFRSFLITKLMNGEKAAYVSPVFSNKRQRTLESLISGLQNDQWLKPEKFGLKKAVSQAVTNREHKKAFLELGQSLKVNKIMQGAAPTSVNNVGGLLALKNTPWEPHAVLSNFNRPITCGDAFGSSLLVSCDLGIYYVTENGARHVFDRSMAALQMNILEDYGVFVVRIRKNGRIYVIPLSEILNERQNILCRRHCGRYYVKKSKGSHLYTISRQESPFLAMAIAVGKRLSIYSWDENVKSVNHPAINFRKQTDFMVQESPVTLTLVPNYNNKLMLCVGLRHRFDVINVETKQVTLLKNIVTYRKPKLVSALDVFDDKNPELLLTYSHTSVFVCLRDNITEIVSFFWNNAPKAIVCAFPYILGFSENSIEIRLMVNGNLVHTHCVPHMKLITAKTDIYFTSCVYSSTPGTLNRRTSQGAVAQTFMKIGLSDLAGLNSMTEPEEFNESINEVMARRNIGVSDHHYSSKRNNAINRLKDVKSDRPYSASAAFCSPIINVRHDVVDITSVEEEEIKERMKEKEEKKKENNESKNRNKPENDVNDIKNSPKETTTTGTTENEIIVPNEKVKTMNASTNKPTVVEEEKPVKKVSPNPKPKIAPKPKSVKIQMQQPEESACMQQQKTQQKAQPSSPQQPQLPSQQKQHEQLHESRPPVLPPRQEITRTQQQPTPRENQRPQQPKPNLTTHDHHQQQKRLPPTIPSRYAISQNNNLTSDRLVETTVRKFSMEKAIAVPIVDNTADNEQTHADKSKSLPRTLSTSAGTKHAPMLQTELFYAPTKSDTNIKKRHSGLSNHRSLEMIGARHLDRQKSNSLQSFQRPVNKTFSEPQILGPPLPPQRCNSSTITTKFDSNDWNIIVGTETQQQQRPVPLVGKSTQI